MNSTKLLVERKVSLSASSSPSSSQSGKVGEDTRETFVAGASAAPFSGRRALSVRFPGYQPDDQTARFPPSRAVKTSLLVLASRVATSTAEIYPSCGGKRPTVSTRASRKAFLSLF